MLIDNNIKTKIKKYVNGFDIIYWINLDRSNERRENMLKMLSNFPIQNIRVSAIDGRLEPDETIHNKIITTNYNKTKIEFACLLSHLNTIRIFSESSYNVAMIMEDDMTLEFVKYWSKDINSIIKEAPPDWEIIMLSYINPNLGLFNEIYTLNKIDIWGTGAYLININGAKKLMNYILENNKYNLHGITPTADEFIYNSLIAYIYKYPYFTYSDINDSTIHENHLNLHQTSKKNIINELDAFYKTTDEFKNIETLKNTNTYIVNFFIILFIIIILYFLKLNWIKK